MGAIPAVLIKVLKSVLWSFLAEKVLAKAVWAFLEYAAKQTDNKLDDQAVKDAKEAFYTKQ